MSSTDPVQDQLDAYNRHDLEAFLACYAPDAEIRYSDGTFWMRGHDEMRAAYGQMFADYPESTAEVPNRLHAGQWTVDEELVQVGDNVLHVAMAYQVRDGLIQRAVTLQSDPE